MGECSASIASILSQLSADISDFEVGKRVISRSGAPSSDEFYREFVSKNRPCLFKEAVQWPALGRWSLASLCQRCGDSLVTCTSTPDGRADAVTQSAEGACFALPHTAGLKLRAFQDLLKQPDDARPQRSVPSIQFQNSNLTDELPGLLGGDVEASIPWASAAFGCEPDAVNIWIGDQRCSTSFHKVCTTTALDENF